MPPLIGNTKAVKGQDGSCRRCVQSRLGALADGRGAEKRQVAGEARKQAEEAAGWPLRPLAPLPLMIWPPRKPAALFSEAEDAAKAAKRAESDRRRAAAALASSPCGSYFAPVLTDKRRRRPSLLDRTAEACRRSFCPRRTDVRNGKRQIPASTCAKIGGRCSVPRPPRPSRRP